MMFLKVSRAFTGLLAIFTLLYQVTICSESYITLINATPYDWNLTGSVSYEIVWNPPEIIKAGKSPNSYLSNPSNCTRIFS